MKGKWASGIVPRNFSWVIKDQLAVCERPGGYGTTHRRVRRTEEIIWLREQGFDRIISLLPSPHNLHAYDELGVKWQHVPFSNTDEAAPILSGLYADLRRSLAGGQKLVVHAEEVGDRLQGVMAGYLVTAGLVPEGTRAIAITEHLLGRQMGPVGRELVAVAGRLAPAP
jgi:hypothetical protein